MPRNRDDDDDYEEDDRPRRRRRSGADEAVATVIPFRNGLALAAYYTSIFGLIPCVFGGGLLGIVPFVLGILGFMKVRNNPEAHGTAHAMIGIILGGVEMLAGCAVIAFVGWNIAFAPR